MAFTRLSQLFDNEKAVWRDTEIKHFIQEYLRRRLRSDRVYCQAVGDGVVLVRVGSPALYQAAYVLEYDLRRELKEMAGFDLERLKVIS